MPSTYTTNLGIEKIATGEQSGTWGTTTNTNLDLIDEAVNGVEQVTLSVAGSSGSPNDLPVTNGASSDGRNKFIEFIDGGDLGGTAYVQLTPNDAEKIVFIRNSLSAARDITIFQGTYNASNDFVIPNGADVVLKFDGAGAGAVVSDVYVNLTPTKLTTAEADVTTGNITTVNATTVDTTNVEVTNLKAKDGTSAGSIADSTGVVTLASSVLTTTDINGGTIDGVTIGGASAGAGTFTNLTAAGTALVSSRVGIGADLGSNPSGADPDADNLVIDANGADVGITLDSDTTAKGSIFFADGGTGDNLKRGQIVYDHSADYMKFATNATERMRIDSSGRLLVAKTTDNVGTVGHTLWENGMADHTRDDAICLRLNRLTSDGTIVSIRKDGTTVGSISTTGGDIEINSASGNSKNVDIIGTDSGGNARGIAIGSGSVRPNADNSIDVGTSSARFKDLYLSGGVYLGGTGAANQLADYEEGTFTPTLNASIADFSSVTYGTRSGTYIKIGDQVTVIGQLSATAVSGGSGILQIGSLPFASGGRMNGLLGFISGLDFDDTVYSQIGLYSGSGGGTKLNFTASGDNTTAIEVPIATFTSTFNLQFTVTYFV